MFHWDDCRKLQTFQLSLVVLLEIATGYSDLEKTEPSYVIRGFAHFSLLARPSRLKSGDMGRPRVEVGRSRPVQARGGAPWAAAFSPVLGHVLR